MYCILEHIAWGPRASTEHAKVEPDTMGMPVSLQNDPRYFHSSVHSDSMESDLSTSDFVRGVAIRSSATKLSRFPSQDGINGSESQSRSTTEPLCLSPLKGRLFLGGSYSMLKGYIHS
mmetsp:Transcript_136/g.251  ORF Transcript_136/g.251 Transcript_136/m.251 type:complete len:118 (+) Transcript_136:256-609(+)